MVCPGCAKEVKVKINKDKCIGCGMCTSLKSDVFEMDVDGKAKVKKEKVLICEVQEIVENCPGQAIEIEEEN